MGEENSCSGGPHVLTFEASGARSLSNFRHALATGKPIATILKSGKLYTGKIVKIDGQFVSMEVGGG